MILILTGVSTDAVVIGRLRASGTDINSSDYAYGYAGTTSAGTNAPNFNTAQTSFDVFQTDGGTNSSKYVAKIDLYKPKLTDFTTWLLSFAGILQTGGVYSQTGGGNLNVTTSCDSFSALMTSGTFSGKIIVYGYGN